MATVNIEATNVTSFSELNIFANIKEALKEMKLDKMTPIQIESIPHVLKGSDVMAAAKTGSGKTLAFLVPLLNKILSADIGKKQGTQAIIISPTRELSLQIYCELKKLILKSNNIVIGLIIGGNSKDDEIKYLTEGVTILVATPGRLLDHLQNTKTFVYRNLSTLVIDEADRLMEQGFMEEMSMIMHKLPKKRQTLLFSATLQIKEEEVKKDKSKVKDKKNNKKETIENKVMKLAYLTLKSDCAKIDLSCVDLANIDSACKEDSTTNSQLNQFYVVCKEEDKFRALYSFLRKKKGNKIIVFMSTHKEVLFYDEILKHVGLKSLSLVGKQVNKKRLQNLTDFQQSTKGCILLCTNVAARGLHIDSIDWVIQYDPPNILADYVHRVGRTARATKTGQSLLLLREMELDFLTHLQKEYKVVLKKKEMDSDKLANIQSDLEKYVLNKNNLEANAVQAFQSLICDYKRYQLPCFDVYKLNMMKLAKTFGLDYCPNFVLEAPASPQMTQADKKKNRRRRRNSDKGVGYNSSDDDYFIPNKRDCNEF